MVERITRERASGLFHGTSASFEFSREQIIPQIRNVMNPSMKERAIIGTYFRMHAWVGSIVKLTSFEDFQGVSTGARSLFEMLLDIKLIEQDSSGEFIERFHAFPSVEHFRVTRKLVNFGKENKKALGNKYKSQQDYVDIKTDMISDLATKHWGMDDKKRPIFPDHWSGLGIIERARKIGIEYLEEYYEDYSRLSWYVHAGPTCYAWFDEDDIVAAYGLAQVSATKCFLSAIKTCGNVFKINIAIDSFWEQLRKIERIPAEFVIEWRKKEAQKSSDAIRG